MSETIVHATAADGSFSATGSSAWNATHTIAGTREYGFISDSTIQTIASTTVAYPITFDTNEALSDITHSTSVDTSRITVDKAGVYKIDFDGLFDLTSGANETVEVWLRVNGTDVPRSNNMYSLVNTQSSADRYSSWIYTFTAGQYFELVMRSSSTSMRLLAVAAGTNPTRPAMPSAVVSVFRI
jgi:hypothetical protein